MSLETIDALRFDEGDTPSEPQNNNPLPVVCHQCPELPKMLVWSIREQLVPLQLLVEKMNREILELKEEIRFLNQRIYE